QPDAIVAAVLGTTAENKPGPLDGKTVLVTAGPTREEIDPVRFISNRSSGKMGYAVAEAAKEAGAKVILVSGPVALPPPPGVEVVHIESASELYTGTHDNLAGVDIFIATAAVSDYRPAAKQPRKIKKGQQELSINLVKAPDTLAAVAAMKDAPFTVGFAAETNNVREYALAKLKSKRLDMIVANKVGRGLAFDQPDNAVDVFWRNGEKSIPRAPKKDVATQLVRLIAKLYTARQDRAKKVAVMARHRMTE
ncbi:MAG: bifunctional phosphopantothenoylcysteine decarboxylase/phosphopantothenate--cysteine ligase CoaBC, partial [Gammaproteobacteria bacterium]|nr:bifunctional phosphopantothenoylcysteine decarboxylase/phosphopantothenate--cysteine ligase CoaBC [Gammaproteobacteria bacterium]